MGLTKKTLTSIYNSLIRSLIDYSAFILTRLSKKRRKQLQAIQNAAIRAIFKMPYDTPSSQLNNIAQIPSLQERMSDLNEAYTLNAILNENPLFDELKEEYESLSSHYKRLYKTFLC